MTHASEAGASERQAVDSVCWIMVRSPSSAKYLFGSGFATARPETGATATGEDDRPKIKGISHGVEILKQFSDEPQSLITGFGDTATPDCTGGAVKSTFTDSLLRKAC